MRSHFFKPGISKHGFLPEENPLSALPNQVTLNKLMRDLSLLIRNKQLRNHINQLSSLPLTLSSSREKATAILMLTMLIQAYVWETPHNPAHEIPDSIALPLLSLCKSEDRYPTLTYADYILNNWQLKNPSLGFLVENIEPLFTFTSSEDEAWFIKIHVAIEAACSKAIHAAYKTTLSSNSLIHCLDDIASSLQKGAAILPRMIEKCRPDFFYHTIRIYLNGWNTLKTGVQLAGVTYHYSGASGAQSSIIPAIDTALGIEHEKNAMFQTLMNFRHYMPSHHRKMLEILSQSPMKETVKYSKLPDLHEAWDNAVQKLLSFRILHKELAKQFVIEPAKKAGQEFKGTGGTSVDTFLGVNVLSTLRAKL